MNCASIAARVALCVGISCVLQACTAATKAPAASLAKPIFNGTDLAGWDGDPRFWSVEDGLLTGATTEKNPTDHNTFLIYRGGSVTDFEIQFEYVIRSDWANSGLQYRSFEVPAKSDTDQWVVGGYQADIDAPIEFTGILYGERDRGILALRGQKVEIEKGGKPKVIRTMADSRKLAKSIHGKNEWNSYRITVTGNHMIHEINGVVMADVVDKDIVVTESGIKGARTSGVLALQLHSGQPMKIQFRNIMLQVLSAAGSP